MKQKNNIVIMSKEKAFWHKSVEELTSAIEGTKLKLKWEQACLCMAKAHLLRSK